MGWKGTIRSVGALARSIDREQKRQTRERERQQKVEEKIQELNEAKQEFNDYETHIEYLKSSHLSCSQYWDWEKIRSTEPPKEPKKSSKKEQEAKRELKSYSPSFFDKVLAKTEKKKNNLSSNIEKAKKEDGLNYKQDYEDYKVKYNKWEKLNKIAKGILKGESRSYIEAINEVEPFEQMKKIGLSIEFKVVNKKLLVSTLHVPDEKVIPKDVKNLLKSGKLSTKPMPKTKFNELYQDYVCSNVLRVARELFALLPIDLVIVNAIGNLLNTKTGYKEEVPILSVAIPRKTIDNINFEAIDPSDSINNFVHKMNFKKSIGFNPVGKLVPSNFKG